MTKLRLALRGMLTCTIGFLMVVVAMRLGEALWRAMTSYGR
ncbi:hypothetical protein [Saccharothrix deserti]|nr:hypothetical protein [Saccharothrix deserti]